MQGPSDISTPAPGAAPSARRPRLLDPLPSSILLALVFTAAGLVELLSRGTVPAGYRSDGTLLIVLTVASALTLSILWWSPFASLATSLLLICGQTIAGYEFTQAAVWAVVVASFATVAFDVWRRAIAAGFLVAAGLAVVLVTIPGPTWRSAISTWATLSIVWVVAVVIRVYRGSSERAERRAALFAADREARAREAVAIIFNAFSMTVAQRRREFAMLRALGASRRQVLWSITGEALVMGVLASVVGLFAGLGVAAGVNALFQTGGVDIPRSGLVMEPRTVIVALAVGIPVTLLSAIVPALRATRVPPVAALQEGAALPPSRFARFMPYLAGAAALLGALGILGGMYGGGGTTARLGQIAFGAIFIFVAVAVVSKYFIRPVAGAIGWPLQRVSVVSGRLARDNARRNPERTAATAAALMIGLGVVVFVAVFAQGLKSSFIDSYDKTVRADYVLSGANFLPLPAEAIRAAEAVPSAEVVSVLNVQQVEAGANRSATAVYGIDYGTFQRLWQLDWIDGDDELLERLGGDGVVVEEQTARRGASRCSASTATR